MTEALDSPAPEDGQVPDPRQEVRWLDVNRPPLTESPAARPAVRVRARRRHGERPILDKALLVLLAAAEVGIVAALLLHQPVLNLVATSFVMLIFGLELYRRLSARRSRP